MFGKWREAARIRDLEKRIAKHGWTAAYVGDYQSAPTWAYSIGFHRQGRPEIIVFDLTQEVANSLFFLIDEAYFKEGLELRDGAAWAHPGLEKPLVWKRVHPTRLDDGEEMGWFTYAEIVQNVVPPNRLAAFQLVLPDPDGNFPWDPGYDERLRPLQPALWEPRDLAPASPV